MALSNPKLFGLNVTSFLSDVQDRTTSLYSLNLPPLDLDIIRGSQNAGATRGDWISLSRLSNPLYKTLDRYYYDSQLYSSILDSKSGTNRTLFGNITLNGALSGNAIRYRYLDGTGPSATVKIADISTSRVSAWSSSASPVLDTSPISYGARVGIITGGLLQFGTQSPSVSGPRLQTTLTPQAKEFASEFPTHKIMCNIDGRTISLYAMKGIPVVFTGFFRNLDANIQLTSLINNTPASWKIVDTDNANSFTRFPNQGTTIRYRSAVSKERYIQYYYNPDNISSVTINSANISSIPAVKFQNLTSFNLASNSLVNFPDFTFVAPSIQNLFLNQNPLYLSETATERSLNSNIVTKIPTGLKNLTLGGTFYGSIPENLISNRFTTLTTLNLSRSSGPYFHPDNADANCTLPNVPNTCETYNVYGNDFRAFGTTSGSNYNLKDLTNLVSLDLGGNYYLTDPTFSISSSNTKIQYVSIHSTGLPCPDLSTRTSLTTFYGYYCRNIGSIFTGSNVYKFNGCSSLSTLYFYASPLTGAMPKFTNTSLSYLELRYTALTGGDISGDTSYVIPEKTFELSPNLQYCLIQSGNLLTTPIHPNAFSYTPSLYYLWYISYGRTTGSFPSLAACPSLTYLVLHYNNFTGTVPNFAANRNIYYVDVSYNAFSGAVPAYKNLSNLTYLYLYNNQFTSLQQFQNLPNLVYFYAHNNQISGAIPDFGDCPRLYYLILFNNKLSSYTPGAFSKIYNLRYLDLSGNLLTQQAVNAIIADLFTNYNAVKRGGVTVNLRSNALPSGTALDTIEFLDLKVGLLHTNKMAIQNQGFRKDLNLQENTNDTTTLNNLGGAGIANDLRIIQNNLRNISTVSYNSLSSGFFYFGAANQFVFTNDDVVGVSKTVTVGSGTTLFFGVDYYVCNSNGTNQFKLSTNPSTASVGVNTINVSSVSTTNFYFIRKDAVYQENLINFIQPIIQDTENFSFIGAGIGVFDTVQSNNDTANYLIDRKYKSNQDTTTTTDDLRYEGSVVINDPAKLNIDSTGLANAKSPGIFIGNTRAFSSDNNPWTQVGTALSTMSNSVSVGELYFGNDIRISGFGTESATQVAVTSFTHKIPVVINGETYYLLLRT